MRKSETAYDRAVRYLGTRDHSRFELRRKLIRRYPAAEVDQTLDRLSARGYLNDRSFALSRALFDRQRKRWGDLRIAQDLIRLGIDTELVGQTLQALEGKSPERAALEQTIIKEVGRAGRPGNLSEVKKVFERCLRMGFRAEAAREALSAYFDFSD